MLSHHICSGEMEHKYRDRLKSWYVVWWNLFLQGKQGHEQISPNHIPISVHMEQWFNNATMTCRNVAHIYTTWTWSFRLSACRSVSVGGSHHESTDCAADDGFSVENNRIELLPSIIRQPNRNRSRYLNQLTLIVRASLFGQTEWLRLKLWKCWPHFWMH